MTTYIIDGHDGNKGWDFWAAWVPDLQAVRFGGFWWTVPDMPAKAMPSGEAIRQWIAEHESPEAHPGRFKCCVCGGWEEVRKQAYLAYGDGKRLMYAFCSDENCPGRGNE